MEAETSIIIYGATGNLAQKKLFPALFELFNDKKVSERDSVIAFSRRPWNDDDFRSFTKESFLKRHGADLNDKEFDQFLKRVTYVQGTFEDESGFKKLSVIIGKKNERVNHQTLHILSVSPEFYSHIIPHVGLIKKEAGGTHCLLIEKPFGKDKESAEDLNNLLHSYFEEGEVMRVDHYLRKYGVYHIADLRRENRELENLWNDTSIDTIEIRLVETAVVGGRGDFYDSFGALRDVGQNHLLVALAIALMDLSSQEPEHLRRARVTELLQLDRSRKDFFIRGQYEGYREETESLGSETETFFSIPLMLQNPRWKRAQITLLSGKAFHSDEAGLTVRFKKEVGGGELSIPFHNRNLFTAPEWLSLSVKDTDVLHLSDDGYQGVLSAALSHNTEAFASMEEIRAAWKLIEVVRSEFASTPLTRYSKGEDVKNILPKIS